MKIIFIILSFLCCLSINAQTANVGSQKTADLLLQAAENDYDPKAQYQLALMHLSGNKVQKDSIAAARYLLDASAGGFLKPNLIFGNYHREKANRMAEIKLLELCTINGAEYQGYYLYLAGCLYFAKEEYETAEIYFKKAVVKGSALGAAGLGLMYLYISANSPTPVNGGQVKKSFDPESVIELMDSWKMSDNSAVIQYLKKKKWSETDNVAFWLEEAMIYGLGNLPFGVMSYSVYAHLIFAYNEGIGVPQNIDNAIAIASNYLLDEEAEDIWDDAEDILMNSLERKDQIQKASFRSQLEFLYDSSKNPANARIKKVHALAAYCLGELYFKLEEYGKAFTFLTNGAEYGNTKAMIRLAECYRRGKGTTINKAKETYWLEKAKK